jgi:hypothetical protein
MRTRILGMAVFALLLPATAIAEEKDWSLTASISGYVIQNAPDYLQPTLAVDSGRLHVEFRYNYEDYDTGSLFLGYNFRTAGTDPGIRITPIAGLVLGQTNGIAPGILLDVKLGPVDLHSESEYVITFSSSSFFYSWSELGAHLGIVRAGVSVQRTKEISTPREVAVGPFLGLSFSKVDATLYFFDPFDSDRFLVAYFALTL